jgi:TRAP-type C4-dicarboxylate transport system permease large subunit
MHRDFTSVRKSTLRVTVVIIMGGILSGIFTPTESAAVACVWAFFVTMFIGRRSCSRDLRIGTGY